MSQTKKSDTRIDIIAALNDALMFININDKKYSKECSNIAPKKVTSMNNDELVSFINSIKFGSKSMDDNRLKKLLNAKQCLLDEITNNKLDGLKYLEFSQKDWKVTLSNNYKIPKGVTATLCKQITFEINNNIDINNIWSKCVNNKFNNEYNMDISDFKNEELLNYGLGLCIGAGIGDSLGSYVEFSEYNDDTTMSVVMEMNGGGTWGDSVTSGQVTDDTELALALAKGVCKNIVNGGNKNIYDSKYAIQYYKEWIQSKPFDKGNTTVRTIGKLSHIEFNKNNVNDVLKTAAMKVNYESSFKHGNCANGSLMRIMPLSLYCLNIYDNNKIYNIIKEDSALTHYNEYVFHINTIYTIAIKYLLHNYNELNKNINAINYCRYNYINRQIKNNPNKYIKTVKKWFEKCFINVDDINSTVHLEPAKKGGFLKVAFQRAFFHLYHGRTVYDALYQTIREGGDTDTNAAIVAGLLGCYHGLLNIHTPYVSNVYNCVPGPLSNHDRASRRVPFQPKLYIDDGLVKTILKYAPNDVQIACENGKTSDTKDMDTK